MKSLDKLLKPYKKDKIAIYGLSTETEKILCEISPEFHIAGLLDGYRTEGILYGKTIISMEQAIYMQVKVILVVARPGSCRAIAKRIGKECLENDIALYDVRGRNLLLEKRVFYDFRQLQGDTKRELLKKIENADVISFDLFDTLITRKVLVYTDIFELLDLKLREMGICIPDFVRLRLVAEKELSKSGAPRLEEIYAYVLKAVGGSFLSVDQLAEMEWQIDLSAMLPREDMCRIYRNELSKGSGVMIVTDSYYSKEKIEQIFEKFVLPKCSQIIVSCEYGTSKGQNLYEKVLKEFQGKKLLHIGDDEVSDIRKASENGIDTYHIYNGLDLFDAVGGFGVEQYMETLSDRVKVGMFVSNIFNSPFWFDDDEKRISVSDPYQIGYLFCAPVITDFVLWLKEKASIQQINQILFCARDGYLFGRLFREAAPDVKSIYFLSSRIAAIRAGMESDDDIAYVDSMKYFGSPSEALYTRFGIKESDIGGYEQNKAILYKAKVQRKNYQEYIGKLDIRDGDLALFDFVAKGTTQLYLRRLFRQHVKGFYFLQLEPEFMADKELDIEPFYSDEEKNGSVIFNSYYILEPILTSPYSQMLEFDENGVPQFAEETRSKKDIQCLEQAQNGIQAYFREYRNLCPISARKNNKKLDEIFLSLIDKVKIADDNFLNLKVEDPFFNRMSDMTDML